MTYLFGCRLFAIACIPAIVLTLGSGAQAARKTQTQPEANIAETPPSDALWTKACDKSANGTDICFVQQFAISKQQKAVILHVQVGHFGPLPDMRFRMLLTTPLGVVLPPGISLSLDGEKPIILPYETCQKEGCVIVAVLEKEVLDSFLKGKILAVRYMASQNKQISVPIRLDGLSDALKALQTGAQ